MTSFVSFSALRTFVEVGRQGSIKRAAQELNVTPGAVSQQVKALEIRFGVQLLERGNREVKLSPPGLRLFGKIAPGFEQIDDAVQLFRDRKPGPQSLIVSTTPSLAACWLTPRLGRFAARHPKIEVRIETSAQLADIAGGTVDVAIRYGSGDYPGLSAAFLFAPMLSPVASPSLLVDGPITNPADCLRYPLLQDRDRADWSIWLGAHGIRPDRNATKGPSYADDALLIEGVVAGQGLAIVRDIYAARALDAGRIMRAIDAPVPTTAEYFVVVHPDRMTVPKIAAFRQWIMQEAGVG
jgi:LysR family glycine cleavage system transcriptional activator